MRFDGFPDRALVFYEGLEADNSKPYWTDHKAVYESCVREPVLALLAELEPEFGPGTVFRPYRDVRFSRDKSPYKTHVGAVVDGKDGQGGLYVQLSAAGLLVAGGYWATAADQVERWRRAVADEVRGAELARIVAELRRRGFLIDGHRLKTSPRGYPADHPRVELLKHRSITGDRRWEPEPWLHNRTALTKVRQAWRALAPLNTWLGSNVGPSDRPNDRPR